MTDWLPIILEFTSKYYNPYYILPFCFVFIVLCVQWKKSNTNLWSLLFYSFEIGSITTSVEYIFMFLLTGLLPESIALIDKIFIFMGTSIAFLVIFHHTTEGTWIGSRIDVILNKYFLSKPELKSVSPFTRQFEKLKSLRENIITENKHQVNNAYQVFLENGSSIMMLLTKHYPDNCEEITFIQTLYDNCKNNFKDMFDLQVFDEKQTVKTASSVSEFIGYVDGFTKSSK